MKVRINVESVKGVSQDIQDVSRQLEKMSLEVEAVRRELGKQTEFGSQIRALRKAADKMTEEESKTADLARALAGIGNLYENTETDIEGRFESKRI